MSSLEDSIQQHVRAALSEDLGERGDLTSEALVPAETLAVGTIHAKESGCLAGIDLAVETFRQLDPDCEVERRIEDGRRFQEGEVVLVARGRARALLAAERTALNFLQRLSGIATLTSAFVDELRGSGAVVLETRKTAPGLRVFEKYAVRVGGGTNHRFGLFDRILIKENHVALAGFGTDAAGYRRAVEQAVKVGGKHGPVTVEVRDIDEAEAALLGGADILLLDNMDVAELQSVVRRIRELSRSEHRDVLLEASGGISVENAAAIAATGVDRLSVGALTHSARAIDLSMLVEGV